MKVNITIAFFRGQGNGMISRLIEWWTNSKYYHTEIKINDIWVTSTDINGVTRTSTNVDKMSRDEYSFVVKLTNIQYANLMNWVDSKVGSKYDFLGIILSQILPTRIDNPNKWFCSEICTKILQLALVEEVYDLTPNMVSPGKLAKIFGVEK